MRCFGMCAAVACTSAAAPLLLLVGTRRHDSTHCFRLHPISHARSVHAHAEQRASTETQASQPARSYGHGSGKSTGRWQEKWFQSILACRPKAHAVVNCCNHRNRGPICPAPPAPLALTPAWMQSIRATAPCPRTATSCSRHAAAAANDRLPCSLAMQKQPWQPPHPIQLDSSNGHMGNAFGICTDLFSHFKERSTAQEDNNDTNKDSTLPSRPFFHLHHHHHLLHCKAHLLSLSKPCSSRRRTTAPRWPN